MWKVHIFVLTLMCGYAMGETDLFLFEQEPELNWEKNDILNDILQPQSEDSQKMILASLCDNYDLQYKNEIINCNQLKFVVKTLDIGKHSIKKRDVEEEGSGEGPSIIDTKLEEELPNETNLLKEIDTENETQEEAKESNSEKEVSKKPEETLVTETDFPSVEPLETTPKNTENNEKTELPITELTTQKPKESNTDDLQTEEPKILKDSNPVESQTNEPKIDISDSPVSELDKMVGKEDEVKKGRILTQEEINNEQSGVALLNNAGNMIESDEKVSRMKPKESIKASETLNVEEGKVAQASANPGRKDNTLLISLFAAVLVVGAAAFTYKMIKKRQNTATETRNEQNGTSKSVDPEEGREMKPLMKTEEPKTTSVEYNDEK